MAKICRIIPLRTLYNVSVNSVDQGDNSGEEMVDRSGHTQRTSDLHKKTEAEYLERAKKALAARRNRSQGVTSLVPVVTECEGSRKGAGLEVGFRPYAFSVKKRILANSRLLTCPGIAAAHFQAQ